MSIRRGQLAWLACMAVTAATLPGLDARAEPPGSGAITGEPSSGAAPAAVPPASPAAPLAPASPSVPVRAQRRFGIAGELGWNGLAGVGLNGTYNLTPAFSIDVGAGLSLAGLKAGLRGRVNLLQGEWTPFLGAGLLYAGGGGGQDLDVKTKDGNTVIRVLASPYAQAVVGASYVERSGFTFTGTVGYALLLRKTNVQYVSGPPQPSEDFRRLLGSGAVVSAAFGYAF